LSGKDQSKIVKSPAQSTIKCYELDVKPIGEKSRFMVAVDPNNGFLVRKVEQYTSGTLSTEAEVMSYSDRGGGVFVPTRIREHIYLHDKLSSTITTDARVTVKSVNQPIPSQAFDVVFPEWTRVMDHSTGKIYIWGKNGPYKTTIERDAPTAPPHPALPGRTPP